MKPVKEYIGDGVYIEFDGYQLWLKAAGNQIAVESDVFIQMLDYVKRNKFPGYPEL